MKYEPKFVIYKQNWKELYKIIEQDLINHWANCGGNCDNGCPYSINKDCLIDQSPMDGYEDINDKLEKLWV